MSTITQEAALANQMATMMRLKLREKAYKPHWASDWSPDIPAALLRHLMEEVLELWDARFDPNPDAVWREAADVANLAAMVADVTHPRTPR